MNDLAGQNHASKLAQSLDAIASGELYSEYSLEQVRQYLLKHGTSEGYSDQDIAAGCILMATMISGRANSMDGFYAQHLAINIRSKKETRVSLFELMQGGDDAGCFIYSASQFEAQEDIPGGFFNANKHWVDLCSSTPYKKHEIGQWTQENRLLPRGAEVLSFSDAIAIHTQQLTHINRQLDRHSNRPSNRQ